MEYISRYEILQTLCERFHIQDTGQVTLALIIVLMAVYVIKNLYILFLTYKQNSFITRNRNKMISRVMAEFLNRPYEKYLGADIPTVFRITDSDIPQTFSLILAMLQLASEVVVSLLIFIVLLLQSVSMTLFIIAVFGVLTLFIIKVCVLSPQTMDLHSCPKPIVFVLHTFLSAKVTRMGLLV